MTDRPQPRVTAGRREHAARTDPTRQLTGPRREVLAALEACGPSDAAGVTECWKAGQPQERAHLGDLTTTVSRLLRKLEALNLVEPVDEGFAITSDGIAALHAARPS